MNARHEANETFVLTGADDHSEVEIGLLIVRTPDNEECVATIWNAFRDADTNVTPTGIPLKLPEFAVEEFLRGLRSLAEDQRRRRYFGDMRGSRARG
jgi:hypothetical protein